MEESEQKRQLELLGVIKAELERDISAFDTEDAETVYDKEEDAFYLTMYFGKGEKMFSAVVTHDGQLINYSSNIPKILIANIHNILIRTMNQVRFGEIYAWTVRGVKLKKGYFPNLQMQYQVLVLSRSHFFFVGLNTQ